MGFGVGGRVEVGDRAGFGVGGRAGLGLVAGWGLGFVAGLRLVVVQGLGLVAGLRVGVGGRVVVGRKGKFEETPARSRRDGAEGGRVVCVYLSLTDNVYSM